MATLHTRPVDAIPLDTTADAHAVQAESYRQLGGRGRLDIMFGLNATVRRLALDGVRARHPDYSDVQVQQAYRRLVLSEELVRAAWPDEECVDP